MVRIAAVQQCVVMVVVLWSLICVDVVDAERTSPLIIDHTCTDLAKIPDTWITEAKSQFRVGYGHTSHGSQLVSGMETFRGESGSLYYYTASGWGLSEGLFLNDYWGNAGGAGDLGHNGDLSWRDATIYMLSLSNNDRNVVIWSWCGGVSDNSVVGINTYLSAMDQLEIDYPDIIFIYMTGHLDGSGESGNLHLRNTQIRDYCIANNKVLFDFADIESYNPDGLYFLNLYADDGCNYTGGNWAQQWCSVNPESPMCISCSCAHSEPLNCNLKGRAFWWMMARLAGWSGLLPSVQNVTVTTAGTGNITWDAPIAPGCTDFVYDVLRSTSPSDFSSAFCVVSDQAGTTATDTTNPSPEFYYLVRVENSCGSTLGEDSNGAPRTGMDCDQ